MTQLFAGVGGLHEIFPMDTLHCISGVRVDASRGMKRSSSEMYVNDDVDVGCVPPAHVDQKRSKQGCASSEEIAPGTPPGARVHNLPQQLAFPSDWAESESLFGPIIPSFEFRINCGPCVHPRVTK